MSVLYDDSIDYNQGGISYIGSIAVTVPGLDSPIILSNIKVYFTERIDGSNLTTIGLVTINSAPLGLMNFEGVNQGEYTTTTTSISDPGASAILGLETSIGQAQQLAESNIIYLVGLGSGTTVEVYTVQN